MARGEENLEIKARDPATEAYLVRALKTTIPLVLVETVSSLYSLADTYFVSGLGMEALAGVGVAGYIIWLYTVVFALFQTPLMILVSQSIGAELKEKAREVIGEACVKGGFTILLVTIAYYLASPIFLAVQSGLSGTAYDNALTYLLIRVAGLPVFYFSMCFDTAIIATARTRITLLVNTLGLTANIILDPLLIYGYLGFPRLGIAGAAYATVISSVFTIPLQIHYLGKLGLKPALRNDNSFFTKIICLGAPAFLERLVFSLGNNVYAGVISRISPRVMAAHNIGLRIESLIYMPGFAFATTASTLVGQKIGEGRVDEARKVGFETIKLGALTMGLLGLVIAAGGRVLVTPFSPDEEIAGLAATYLLIAGLSELGLGLSMVVGGAIRGAGNTKIPFLVNTASLYLFRVVPSILLSKPLGVIGPWLAMFIDVYARGLILLAVYRRVFHKLAVKHV